MPQYKQYATCLSRNNRILYHCYCKVEKAYKTVSRSCYGDAGHTTIMLIPIYKQMLKRCKPKTKTVNLWMPEAIERLQDCIENTDWNVFKEGNNLHTFTKRVTANIKFCQGACIPCMGVTKYPNSSPLCNKTIKAKIKAKDKAFLTKSSDPELIHRTKGDLLKAIRDAKKH